MQNLKSLTDSEIMKKTENLAAQERKIHTELLRYLRELDRRRLYLELGYDSLYKYCTRHLKLSEGSASRRISSMKLIRDLSDPERTFQSLEKGEVNLSTLSQTQSFLRVEKKARGKEYPPEKRAALIQSIQGRSQRECELLFATISPHAVPKERERILTETQTEVRFVMSQELREKLEKIRSLLSHQTPDASYADLLDKMAEIVLKKIDPERKTGRKLVTAATDKPQSDTGAAKRCDIAPTKRRGVNQAPAGSRPGYIPEAIRRAVLKRDGGACVFTDPATGRRCGSRFQVQLDHRVPTALGGPSTIENLRCLCRAHNIQAAIQVYGPAKMEPYLTKLR